jgi:aminoglycoside phosphotransferase (APT) family kinase protein
MAALTDSQFDDLALRLSSVGVNELRSLPGGASSVTLAGLLDERPVVVKVAPPGVAPTLHRDVLRQSRIIRTLGPAAVPVPEVLIEEPGDPPGTPPLFIMSFLDGVSLEPLFDRGAAPADSTVIAERLRSAAKAMAQLHTVAPAAVGLDTEPVISPVAEIERWCRLLDTIDPALVGGWKDVDAALRTSVPTALPPAIVHGDFRLGNLLAVDDRITAVIDWEIWSIGDPRVDVGWFLINADQNTYRRATPYSGSTPPPAELSDIYAETLGRQVPDLTWFQGLACFKSAATWSLIVKHNRRRATPDPDIEEMATAVPSLLARAIEFLDATVMNTSNDR